jgi:V8-like Glu-specific endopeptidase
MVSARIFTTKGPLTFVHPQGEPLALEKIIGKNGLIPVLNNGINIPPKFRPLINAFGLISMGCTATHIGNGFVLTAGHCFDAPRTRTENVSCPQNTTVKWGLRADASAYLVSRCTQILAYEFSAERDYAIFKVDSTPAVHIDVDFTSKPRVGTNITVFGHPQARPLEWSGLCTVQSALRGGWSKNQFSHQCDTEPGNSGSVIMSVSSLKIVGIHNGGRTPWNYATFITDTPLAEVKKSFLAMR